VEKTAPPPHRIPARFGRDVVKAPLSLRKAREAVDAVAAGGQAEEAAVAAARARSDAGQVLKAGRPIAQPKH